MYQRANRNEESSRSIMAAGAPIDMEQQSRTEHYSERRRSIELRAYHLWQERGRPWGSPETDWFRAEQEIRAEQQSGESSVNQGAEPEPLAVVTARVVGAVLGSVSGVVAAVSNSLTSE